MRYVRGNPTYGVNSFKDNGDGTVTDEATRLMWSQDDSGVGMDWEHALAWVQEKNAENYLGHNDWRLRTPRNCRVSWITPAPGGDELAGA